MTKSVHTVGEPPRPSIRVVIIDDHRVVADSVTEALEKSNDISVVAAATTGAEGLAAVRRHRPDVLLLDQRLPDTLGTDLLPGLLEASPETRVLLVTGASNDAVLRLALEGGCAGFLTKGERAATLIDAVRKVAAGEAVLSPRDVQRLMHGMVGNQTRLGHDLTARERDVLALLATGCSTAAIAEALFVSTNTVRNYNQSVIRKLGAHSKLEAVAIALRENIVAGG